MSDPKIQEALSPKTSAQRLAALSGEPEIAVYVAQNPAAPPRLLEDLSRSPSSEVRRAVVQNPNSPPRALLALAAEFPGEFLENPILPLVGLAQPKFFEHLPDASLKALLCYPKTPVEIIERLGEHPAWGARAALAALDSTTPQTLARLLCDPHPAVRKAAAQHPNMPKELLSLVLRAGTNLVDPAPADPTITAQQVEYLVSLGGFARALAAAHPSAPGGLLEQLFEDPRPSIQEGLARNPSTPLFLLEKLARSASAEVRGGVAQNKAAPYHLLERLAKDPDDVVLCELAKNVALPRGIFELALKQSRFFGARASRDFHTSPHLLAWLSEEQDEDITDEVSRNPSTPTEVLLRLAKEGPEPLRHMMARTLSMPPVVLAVLLVDFSSRVRESASHHDNVPKELREELIRAGSVPEMTHLGEPDPSFPAERLSELSEDGFYARFLAAAHPNTPIANMELLSSDKEADIRWALTQNPTVPLSLLEKLSEDESSWVREGVGQSKNTTPEILGRLLADEARAVRQTAAIHPRAPKEIWRLLCKAGVRADLAQLTSPSEDLTKEELASLANRPTFARFLAAQHPKLPESLLQKLSEDEHPLVRGGAALNPSALALLVSRLLKDEAPAVRAWCAMRASLPEEKLLQLASDPEEEVRARLLSRPSVSDELLTKLSKDSSPEIRRRVAEKLSAQSKTQEALLATLANDDDMTVRQAAISRVRDQKLLEELANDWHDLIRAEVACNQTISASLLERLSKDLEPLVKAAAASNPTIELALLEGLVSQPLAEQPLSGPEAFLLKCAAENPSAPSLMVEKLSQALSPMVRASVARRPSLSGELFEKLSEDEVHEVRAGAAKNPNAPAEKLSALAQDLAYEVRQAVAAHAKVPLEALKTLATDPVSSVRWAARGQPRLWEALLQEP